MVPDEWEHGSRAALVSYSSGNIINMLVIGFKLVAGAIASNAFTGVAIGVGFIFASLVYSISRNPSQRDELLRFSFIGFSLVEASGLIGLVMSFVLLFGI